MRLLKLLMLLFPVLCIGSNTFAQKDSCSLNFTLLTCGPGEDLYSVFGHSALRVRDITSGTDIIYNYGTFDFEDPDFYVKFVRGKLLYSVSVQKFSQFVLEYQYERRSIIEQHLQLNCAEKARLAEALRVNALEQNRYYKYEFLFDNCSTRLRDIVQKNNDDSVQVKNILPHPVPSFRNMIHTSLEAGNQYWSEFGIDLLLASRIDRKVMNEEAMFLPDYLMKGFDSSVVKNAPLVSDKQTILKAPSANEDKGFYFSPLMVTIGLLLLGVLLTIKKNATALNIFDGFYFFFLGIAGCLMVFMWVGTEHDLCRDNYNILWAMPTHIIAAFYASKNTPRVRKYFSISAILSVVLVLCWSFLPQGMNLAFLPLVILSGLRSILRATTK